MYAIIALLDKTSNDYIRTIWEELREKGFSHYAFEKENMEPHLTLASLWEVNMPVVQQILGQLVDEFFPLELPFSAIGSFLGQSIITLNPVKTPALVHLHSTLHQQLVEYLPVYSLYAPQYWVPHVTLANRVQESHFLQAYQYCLSRCEHFAGFIVGFKLIFIHDNQSISDIYSISVE